jgi:hypothetical protein
VRAARRVNPPVLASPPECLRDDTARIARFASGAVLREEILGCDEENRRLAWSIATIKRTLEFRRA